MKKVVAFILLVSVSPAHSSELGFPASALAEAGQSNPFALPATLDFGKSLESVNPEAKTIKYTGKCYAEIDGRVRINGACPVTWKTGEDLSVSLSATDEKDRPLRVRFVSIFRQDRKWFAHWGNEVHEHHAAVPKNAEDLGKVHKQGSCWANRRVRICEHDT